MATFICRLPAAPGTLRLAVKDLIDVVGAPTTCGSRVVAASAPPASSDAACLAGARAAGVSIVGKANCSELAFSPIGTNPWFGDPVNPLDPTRIPGGSSSGSAVAVAAGEADLALGTDTGGSVRIPAACCGIVGLKTTAGRIPLAGVWPLAPSFDTVGPLAATVEGVLTGMRLLEPGFEPPGPLRLRVGRLRLGADAAVDAAIDAALRRAGLDLVAVDLPGWEEVAAAGATILLAEAAVADAALLDRLEQLDPLVASRLAAGRALDPRSLAAARREVATWPAACAHALRGLDALALPTLREPPPRLGEATVTGLTVNTRPVNVAGLPALSLPVPGPGPIPPSLQLVGAAGAESTLIALAQLVEAGSAG
ncbi:MAG TPA: amidase [Verrucomicrobiae bacterium]|nr:amidase [Verrucomicrobiae bacterium]